MVLLVGFKEDFVWGAATAAYQIEEQPLKKVRDFRFGIHAAKGQGL